jgi:hypothetical protein
MRKIQWWAQNKKTEVWWKQVKRYIYIPQEKEGKKDIEIYVNSKKLQLVNRKKYFSIIFCSKMAFIDHINYIEESARN